MKVLRRAALAHRKASYYCPACASRYRGKDLTQTHLVQDDYGYNMIVCDGNCAMHISEVWRNKSDRLDIMYYAGVAYGTMLNDFAGEVLDLYAR